VPLLQHPDGRLLIFAHIILARIENLPSEIREKFEEWHLFKMLTRQSLCTRWMNHLTWVDPPAFNMLSPLLLQVRAGTRDEQPDDAGFLETLLDYYIIKPPRPRGRPRKNAAASTLTKTERDRYKAALKLAAFTSDKQVNLDDHTNALRNRYYQRLNDLERRVELDEQAKLCLTKSPLWFLLAGSPWEHLDDPPWELLGLILDTLNRMGELQELKLAATPDTAS
jgi:hypothetical protein